MREVLDIRKKAKIAIAALLVVDITARGPAVFSAGRVRAFPP